MSQMMGMMGMMGKSGMPGTIEPWPRPSAPTATSHPKIIPAPSASSTLTPLLSGHARPGASSSPLGGGPDGMPGGMGGMPGGKSGGASMEDEDDGRDEL